MRIDSKQISQRIWLLALGLLVASTGTALAQIPPGYYDTVDTTTGAGMHDTLHQIIDDHTRYPYTASTTDTWDILNLADEDPNDINRVIDIYKNESHTKINGGTGSYNREHVWPKSYGFPVLNDDNYPYTDCHHLFLSESTYNSSRSNKPFRYCDGGCGEKVTLFNNGRGGGSGVYPGNSNWTAGSFTAGTWETWNGRKGDAARAIFYMAVRYEGGTHSGTGSSEPDLILTDSETLIDSSNTGSNESIAYMGLISDLIEWHRQDPVDDDERWHNEMVYSFQGNRNPFVDHPEWVDCVFLDFCEPDTTAPAAPTALAATAGDTTIDLTWNANSENDLAGYKLFRSETAGGPYTQIGTGLLTGTAATDTGLTNGTTYYYVLTAVDVWNNESGDSNEASTTPEPGVNPQPGQVILSEVFYNPSGADDGLEWVELYNAGSTPVDLSGYSLGAGGTDYTYSKAQLSGTIQPDSVFVVGGPTSGSANGSPSFDLVLNFNPDLQNSGTTADGVALFDVPASQVNAATVPVDAVLYGSSNDNGLIDETGSANAPEVGNAGTGASIERIDVAGAWQVQSVPTPNTSPLISGGSNTAPTVSITAPADGSSFDEGVSITFTGSANDAEDGDISANLAWTSDLDGSIGSGASFSTSALSVGAHTITASVTDSGGLQGSDSITVTISAVNTAPTVSITAPADGSSFDEGVSITFTGGANDAEDGDISANLAWTSDLDGSIGSGASFSTSALSVGTHTITASVTDSGGLQGSDSITVIVNTVAGTDTIVITKAQWDGRKKQLAVEGTASDDSVTLTVSFAGRTETLTPSRGRFKGKFGNVTSNPGTVTVTSTGGGSDTATVTTK